MKRKFTDSTLQTEHHLLLLEQLKTKLYTGKNQAENNRKENLKTAGNEMLSTAVQLHLALAPLPCGIGGCYPCIKLLTCLGFEAF